MARTSQPDIDDPRFFQAIEHRRAVQDQRRNQDPKRLEDQEQFSRQYRIDHEEAVGDTCKHLRASQRYEQSVRFQSNHSLPACRHRCGGLDARDDPGCTEEDEAA